ncbi:Bifunctional inhibitor/plant lipid transfer protein/seed storage helical domain containing protein [Trema orientale]|uniref:Bifunctional inhibitor/plant lipid transfer protein/seed storage helical domain containing protein n=1 Tax=Trema orientale TaxID=63057 RepID=A0A2P5EN74_TREOI|nr:Bifunctional inhibitor/plant lipid transfer protein/seed storage helical domain containing protein [Trema orientale]
MKTFVALFVMLLIVLLENIEVSKAEQVNCSTLELGACADAMMSNSPPTALCCSKLKEQTPCLCQYIKDPSLEQFVNSPNAKKVFSTCGVQFPTC